MEDEEEKASKRQLILVGIAVLLTGILLIVKPTHAVFQVNKTINIMDAKVGDFGGPTKTVKAGDVYVDYDEGMIPIAFNSSGQTVRADETNTDSTYYWFDYCQKTSSGLYGYKASGCTFRWANAVLVTDTNRSTYKSATPGTLINESDILAYLVYIPRYSYQLWNANDGTSAVQTINIEFENKTTTPSCGGNTCTTNRVYSTGSNGQMLTHPAFTFGTTELNGIWVGKFDTSPDEATTCYSTTNVTNCNDVAGTMITPRIKPNKNTWRFINLATAFAVGRYFKTDPMYGINSSTIDAHIMKNMEWGAVAYLSQSIHGKRGNQGTEVWNNNYNDFSAYSKDLTGCGGTSARAPYVTIGCSYPYPHPNGVQASTSGTLYGVYDMSGGAAECVMGNMAANGQTPPADMNLGSAISGFTVPYPSSKYYDSYAYGTTFGDAAAYARGYLGDATKETIMDQSCATCGWNNNVNAFMYNTLSWFYRGGYSLSETTTGIWSFMYGCGNAQSMMGFRITLVVE